MHIFLDESGSLTPSDTNFFIVASYTVSDSAKVAKSFRKWQKSKFPKKLRSQPEVKFNDPHLSDKDRFKFIKYLSHQDIRIFYTYLRKKNIPEEYIEKGVVHKTGLLYSQIVGLTLELYFPFTETEFRVFRDQRVLKSLSRQEFDKTLATRLLPQLPAKTLVQIEAMDSTTSPLVQIADWVCGALGRYHEGKASGKEFYEILKPNIVEAKELFSDYWTKKWEK